MSRRTTRWSRQARIAVLHRRDERGSLIVALSVIMVLVLLSSLIFVRVMGNEQIIVARQDAFAGVSGANAGLSDALFQLDQGNTGAGMICLNAQYPADSLCNVHTSSSTPQLTGVSYVARLVSSGPLAGQEWIVQAIGNADTGMKGAVQETLTRSPMFPFALFGKKSLSFTGNTTGNFGTFTPGPVTDGNLTHCPTDATDNPCLYIGSNGKVSCSGPSPASVVGIYYNTGSGGGSDSCGTAQSQNTIYNVADPTAPIPPGDTTYTCPNDGTGQLGTGYGYGTIQPGIYVCTKPISISGILSVDPSASATNPVKIYVILSGAANTSSTAFAQIATDSQINTSITYADMSGGGPTSTDTLPDAKLFQLYTNSIGQLTVDGKHGFVYGGILDAPEASITTNGCKSYFFGAAVINTYTCHGGPNLGLYYDNALSSYYGSWQVSNYQQINPSSVTIPVP